MFLVPANTKKSVLIMGFKRPIDLIIGVVGLVSTVLILLILGDTNTWTTLLACLPAIVAGLLILPIPNYHNTIARLHRLCFFPKLLKIKQTAVFRKWICGYLQKLLAINQTSKTASQSVFRTD